MLDTVTRIFVDPDQPVDRPGEHRVNRRQRRQAPDHDPIEFRRKNDRIARVINNRPRFAFLRIGVPGGTSGH